MKKKIVILAVLVVLCIGTLTMTCMATSRAESALKKDQAYNLSLTGSKCRVTAMGTIGTTPKCYTSMVNTSGGMLQAVVRVSEQDLVNKVETDYKSARNNSFSAGSTIATGGLTRQPGVETVKYIHYGKAYNYTNPSELYDSLYYYIDQVE